MMAKSLKISASFLCLAAMLVGDLARAQQSFSQTSVQIGSISRRTGGAIAKIKLSKPSVLQGMILEVSGAALKLYEVRLNLDNGQSVAVEELSKGEQSSAGQTLESGNLSGKGLVASIEVKAESMGGSANLQLAVVSDQADLRMAVESTNVVNPPAVQPQPEPARPEPPAVTPVPPAPVPAEPEEQIEPPRVPPARRQRPREQRPTVITPPAQNGGAVPRVGCSGAFCIGNIAYAVGASYTEQVQIVDIQSPGQFVVRFLSSNSVSGGWSQADLAATRGCLQGVCVGAIVYRVNQQDTRQVQVVAIQSNGLFVLRFLDSNGLGSGWSRNDIAVTSGCGRSFCVGNTAYNVSSRGYRPVQIVAIQTDGSYVLRFLDSNGLGGNWQDADLARGRGY